MCEPDSIASRNVALGVRPIIRMPQHGLKNTEATAGHTTSGSHVLYTTTRPSISTANSTAGSASRITFRPIAKATGPLPRKNKSARTSGTQPSVSPVERSGRSKSPIGETTATARQTQAPIRARHPWRHPRLHKFVTAKLAEPPAPRPSAQIARCGRPSPVGSSAQNDGAHDRQLCGLLAKHPPRPVKARRNDAVATSESPTCSPPVQPASLDVDHRSISTVNGASHQFVKHPNGGSAGSRVRRIHLLASLVSHPHRLPEPRAPPLGQPRGAERRARRAAVLRYWYRARRFASRWRTRRRNIARNRRWSRSIVTKVGSATAS